MSLTTNTVIQGDALRVLRELPSGIAQVVMADPPYGNVLDEDWDNQWEELQEFINWNLDWVSQSMRVLRDDGLLCIFGQLGKREHAFIHLSSVLCREFQFHDRIIWDRVVGYNERRDSLTPAYEEVLVLRKGEKVKFNKGAVRIPYDKETIKRYLRDKRYTNRKKRRAHLSKGKFLRNIVSVPSLRGSSREKVGHPSQKPIALIQILLLLCTDPGDLVLDPFLGSGTTAVAASQLNRRFLGIERKAKYCRMTSKRLQKCTGQPCDLGRYVAVPPFATIAAQLDPEQSKKHGND